MARFSRRKRVAFAATTLVVSLVVTVAALGLADELLRRHYAASVGLNMWGYRGGVVGDKAPGERRVVMLGGSTTFGYGATTDQTIPARLEGRLNAARSGRSPVTVVNLGFVKEGAWSFRSTLADYAYLGYDLAILHEGYNDLRRPNTRAFRRDSPVFRLTGYLPFLPIVLNEKARAIRYGGDLGGRFGREDPAFHPGLADRATAKAFKAGAEVARSLEQVLGPLTRARTDAARARPSTCGEPFQHYCGGVQAGVEEALARGARVLVVGQPYLADLHIEQQRHLAALLRERFGADRRVAYVDLGWAVDLRDPAYAFDGMHLTPAGNAALAERLVEPVARLLFME